MLLYFHHDVQPPLDNASWETPVWDLTEKDGRWYGRGAADCKGNIASTSPPCGPSGTTCPSASRSSARVPRNRAPGGLEAFVPQHPTC